MIEEWIACQLEAAERGALSAVHVAHPQANAWLRDLALRSRRSRRWATIARPTRSWS
jgi:hypothetical protein